MARYEHLPIYKIAMDLAMYLEQVVRNFSRYHKYTVGSEPRVGYADYPGQFAAEEVAVLETRSVLDLSLRSICSSGRASTAIPATSWQTCGDTLCGERWESWPDGYTQGVK